MVHIKVCELNTELNAFQLYSIFKDRPYSIFLDSVLSDEKLGKYSFIAFEPFMIFRSKGYNIEIQKGERVEYFQGNAFEVLKKLMEQYKCEYDGTVPFPCGCAGYFAYDMGNLMEKLPQQAVDDMNISDCLLGFYDRVIAIDHLNEKKYASSMGAGDTMEQAEKEAYIKLEYIQDCIKSAEVNTAGILETAMGAAPDSNLGNIKKYKINFKPNFTKEAYCRMVSAARRYIRNGDIFQVNLSQRFMADIHVEPFEIYKKLRSISPSPFAAYLNFGEVKVLSSSPERFMKVKGDYIETRPIKGTRPRGRDAGTDMKNRMELLNSGKDKAELTMIIDLERNDIGKVCEFGSVSVPEFMVLEEYATVFHLVSTVTGKIRKGVSPVECLAAGFPGGSITGAPKVRAMEIIEEQEPVKRGLYTGSIGYISFNGDMDTNIAIRTIVIKGNTAFYQVGGGIVWDSSPEAEHQETLDKGVAMKKVLEGI